MISLSAIEAKQEDDDFEISTDENTELKEETNKQQTETFEEEEEEYDLELASLRAIMSLYVARFPDKLASYKKIKFDTLDKNSLLRLRREFELQINLETALSATQAMALQSISALEVLTYVGSSGRINPIGSSELLQQDENFKDNMALVLLKYADKLNQAPELRLCMSIVSTFSMMHKINSSNNNTQISVKTDDL